MLPLTNRRILITRSPGQASILADTLQHLGAQPILIPTIQIAPPTSFAPLDAAISSLATFDWLIFTSANAVEAFQNRLTGPLPANATAVIGPATAKAATAIGLHVTLVPPSGVAESLADALLPQIRPGVRMLLVRAATARDILPRALAAAGAALTIVEAYRTIVPESSIAALEQLFSHPANYPDVITFTSSSTATNLLTLLGSAGLTLPPSILRASIGPITTRTLMDAGFPPHLEAPEPTVASLAQAIATHLNKA